MSFIKKLNIMLFDSLSNNKVKIKLIDNENLKFYVCGPTVYERPHIGNARSIVIYDLFYRFFRVKFDNVTYVRNITDVDDKINQCAKERNISIKSLTSEILGFFNQDIAKLNVLTPNFQPKATEHIDEMIKIIQILIDKGHAYISQGHVLFNVKTYKEYGNLSNRDISELNAGARIEVANYKKDPLDFVLWKPSDDDDDESSIFNSPWGSGRPGWHIECSAMSTKYLGNNFDIHGGGADLQFPHHENEIAQSKCAHQDSHYASYWVHNGFLTVNGEKMSKSLKNFITVNDLIAQKYSGLVIRLLLLSTHYRKPLDFNDKSLEDAIKTINKFCQSSKQEFLMDQKQIEDLFKNIDDKNLDHKYLVQAMKYLADDFNISKILAMLHEMCKESKKNSNISKQLTHILQFLGFIDKSSFGSEDKIEEIDKDFILSKINERLDAKKNKNYQLADKIRQELLDKGVILEDVANDKTNYSFK